MGEKLVFRRAGPTGLSKNLGPTLSHFGSFLGHFLTRFDQYFGNLGPFWTPHATLDHPGLFLVHDGLFWATFGKFGPMCAILFYFFKAATGRFGQPWPFCLFCFPLGSFGVDLVKVQNSKR